MTTLAAVPPVTDEPPATHRHVVEFYESDSELVAAVAGFLAPALAGPGAAVVVATPAHRAAFEAALAAAGIYVAAAAAAGRYVSVDAAHLLATLLVDGMPDGSAFNREVGGLLGRLPGAGGQVRIYGEMVALLWEGGAAGAAVALEDLWNQVSPAHEFELLCAYPMATFDNEGDARAFRRVCEQHVTRPEQVLLAELAYADALTAVINRRTSSPQDPGSLVVAAYRNASPLMASPGGRVLCDLVATELAQAPIDLDTPQPD